MDELLNILSSFSSDYTDLASELIADIKDNLTSGDTINKSVDDAFKSTDFINIINEKLVESIIDCYQLEDDEYDYEKLRDTILNIPWNGDMSLSERLFIISDEIKQQIKDTLISNKLIIDSLADKLNTDITNSSIYNVERSLSAYRNYLEDTDEIDSIISSLTSVRSGGELGDESDRIKQIISVILVGILARGIYVSYKNKYERINNTEGARARYEGLLRKTKNNNDVFGYRWVLSPAHFRFPFDICDVNANANVGYGKGVYKKNKVPIYPAHPHCICRIEAVYKKDVKNVNYSFREKGISDYINSIDSKDRDRLFTKSNYIAYKKSNDYKLMNNYAGFEDPKPRS